MNARFDPLSLNIDAAAEVERICTTLRAQVLKQLRRKGVVLGLSGGIDSTVVAALCVRAFGPAGVLGIFMPEQDSDPESLRLGRQVADWLGVQTVLEDISPSLLGAGCYRRRDDFIRRVFPDYGPGWKNKVVLRKAKGTSGYNVFNLVVRGPHGEDKEARMPLDVYLGIVATTNMKQRTRKQIEYFHADRLQYAVAGTPNRLEYDQGFFVKLGDGAADVKPIAHLYKSQVYALAEYLGVPEEIRSRPSTTDTYSMPQSQEEFYFSLPYQRMDLCLFGRNNAVPVEQVAAATGLTVEQVHRVYRDIESKRRTTAYLHLAPHLVDPVPEIG